MTTVQYSRRQILKSGLVAGVACASLPAWSEINGINEAINKAGRQRMLSQRMAKAWLAVGQDIESSKAESILYDSNQPIPHWNLFGVNTNLCWSDRHRHSKQRLI